MQIQHEKGEREETTHLLQYTHIEIWLGGVDVEII